MLITIDVPNQLEEQLKQFQDRLPEVLERGMELLIAEELPHFYDEKSIMELLISQPTPEQILAVRPSPQLQTRVHKLLALNKINGLSRLEETELERYLTLEHLVRLAKARAFKQLKEHHSN